MGEADGRMPPSGVRITDLGAPPVGETVTRSVPGPRRSPILAVVALVALAGAAYSATLPSGTAPAGVVPPAHAPAVPEPALDADEPLEVCAVHPGACPSPPRGDTAGDAPAPADGVLGSTGSMIVCDPRTGACEPFREDTGDDAAGDADDGTAGYAYRVVPPGQLELLGVRHPDGAVVPDGR
ncbi:hypothetical protein [Arthrobacter sp. MDT1-65]